MIRMLPKLQISQLLLQRLERVKQQCSGCLFGVFYGESTLLLMSYTVESTIGTTNHEEIQHNFPAELDLCGLVKFGDCSDADAHLNDIFKDVDITDNPILLNCELGTLVGLRASIYMHGKLEEVPYEIMEEARLYRDFCFTRIDCTLDIITATTEAAIKYEMGKLRKSLATGSAIFKITPTNVLITSQSVQGLNATNNSKPLAKNKQRVNNTEFYISHLIEAAVNELNLQINNLDKEENRDLKKSKNSNNDSCLRRTYGALGCDYDILHIEILRCKTRNLETATDEQTTQTVPAFSMTIDLEEKKIRLPIQLEAMSILYKETDVNRLYNVLIESVCRALRLTEVTVLENLKKLICDEYSTEMHKKSFENMVPHSLNFYPKEFCHFITCAYFAAVPDDVHEMLEKRKRLHRNFGLATLRPYFRSANRCLFYNDLQENGETPPLLNVHLGVRANGLVGETSREYLVQGNYFYYHYQQQQMNDNGWGCAYRSLQTICSWFMLQGYTKRAVPTHKEIQAYLVRIGDKPKSFIDSTQWIGSTEVSMCLQGFLNVDSRILHVKSGLEMATLASDLVMHFQIQGTPVMIGGGVLAHTILGINYCAQSGNIKFLILDPHYVGNDDLHTIQSKGWCGWKSVGFWDKRSYYNLCLPQRPVMF